MARVTRHFLPLFSLLLIATLWPAAAFAGDPAGRFMGETDFGGAKLPTELRLARAESGKWGGFISQPHGGIPHMALTRVTVEGANVVAVLEVGQFRLTCTCALSEDGNTLTGKMEVAGRDAGYAMSLTRTPMPIDVPGRRIMKGRITAQGVDLACSAVFAKLDSGAWLGTLSVPMQGIEDLSLAAVAFNDDGSVHFEVVINAQASQAFDGRVSDDGKSISGKMTMSGQEVGAFTLEQTDTRPMQNRPQEPKGPFPYRVEEVRYKALPGQGDFSLAGTLTIPAGDGPFPCVVLINGSGLHNRDSALMGHKPFLVIADHFARHGIATLRYDERSVGESGGDASKATSADLADDAVAGLQFLRGRDRIDGARLGVAGHSEGSTIAAIAAAKHPDLVSFVLLLAGPGQPGREIVPAQLERIFTAQGEPAERVASVVRFKREVLAAAFDERLEGEALFMRVLSALSAHHARCPDDKVAREDLLQTAQAEVDGLNNPWVRYFFTFDPREALRKVKCPVLAINGTKDVQVPWDMCLPAIFKALVEGGNCDVTIRALPGLNHLFQTCETGLVTEYSEIEETWSPTALKVMSDWIREKTAKAE